MINRPFTPIRIAMGVLVILLSSRAIAAQPPPAVVVQVVDVQAIQNPDEYTARIRAIDSVDVLARVQGFLEDVAFQPGQMVSAGDLLFEIEPDQYQAAVASAQARVAQATATSKKADLDLARARRLSETQSVAQSVLDEAEANAEIARADVQAARAQLQAAELNLSYTRISAPFQGEISLNEYSVGTLVGPESGPLARLIQLDPIRAVFAVPEGAVVDMRQRMASDDSVNPDGFELRLRLPNGSAYPHRGHIEHVSSEVDPSTGTLPIRVEFPNPDHLLIPNQFVTVFISEGEAPARPVVPQSAVLQDRQGRYVYLLTKDQTVTPRRIRTGARVPNGWAVEEGLTGGETVVVQGIQRLSDDIRVQPVPANPEVQR